MRTITSFIFLLLFATMLNTHVSAQHANLDATYRFLNIPSSPRMAALGGSNAALPRANVSQFFVNPAYLSQSSHGELSASYLNHIADINMGFASTAWNIRDYGMLGVGVRYMNYGDITHTNASGENLGSINTHDMAFNVGFGHQYTENLHIGGAFQFIHSSYHEYRSSGLALSAGIFYDFLDDLTWAGLTVNNLGTQLSYYDETKESLPIDLRASVTRKLQYLPVRISATAHSLNRWKMISYNDDDSPDFTDNLLRHLIGGAEFVFTENFHFRLGYNHYLHEETKSDSRIDFGGFSYGIGINIKGFQFDISRNSYSDIGKLTQLGIQYQLY